MKISLASKFYLPDLYRACFLIPLLFPFVLKAQVMGCTDPQAINYNPSATINNGSCAYAPLSYSLPLKSTFSSPITESSGLVFTDGALWTHNDSGHPPEFYRIDSSTGQVLQTVIVDNAPNIDWEDMAADSLFFYVADVGNNQGSRTDLRILKIAKSSIGTAVAAHVIADTISFSYADQTNFTPSNFHNFDCEAMIVVGDSIFLFTKNRANLQTKVYGLPIVSGVYSISPLQQYNISGLITGADYNPVLKQVLLLGYLSSNDDSFIWRLNDFSGTNFFSGNKRRITLPHGSTWQTEGICFMPGNRFAVSCEATANQPSGFYFGGLNFGQVIGINEPLHSREITVFPNPATDYILIAACKKRSNYVLVNNAGVTIRKGTLVAGTNRLSLIDIPAGNYLLHVLGSPSSYTSKVAISR